MKNIGILLSILITTFCNAQDKIPTQEEARAFFEKEDKSGFLFHSITEDEELFELYAKRLPGDVIVSGTKIYQVIDIKKVHIINFGSIQLRQTLNIGQITELQEEIMKKYNSGVPFLQLIEKYSESKTPQSAVIEWPLESFNEKRKELFTTYKEGEIFAYNDLNNNEYKLYVKNSISTAKTVVYVFEAEYQP